MKIQPMGVIREDGKIVAHRTILKCTVNPVLKAFQFWTSKPYLIASIIDRRGIFHGYVFRRITFI